jgi:hypothetical protein
VPEQKRLLEVLIEQPAPTPELVEAMRRADALFDPLPARR